MKKYAVKDEKLIYSIYKNLRSQTFHVLFLLQYTVYTRKLILQN